MNDFDRPIEHSALQAFITRCFAACGLPAADAGKAATLMTRADLMGQDGHGVFRLPQYVRRIREGGLNVTPQLRTLERIAPRQL